MTSFFLASVWRQYGLMSNSEPAGFWSNNVLKVKLALHKYFGGAAVCFLTLYAASVLLHVQRFTAHIKWAQIAFDQQHFLVFSGF